MSETPQSQNAVAVAQSDSEASELEVKQCLNCGASLQGRFCHSCGQSSNSKLKFFGVVFAELLEEMFHADSRINRTLWPIFFRPGKICRHYLDGMRVSFLHPFRLYLFASLLFFFIVPWISQWESAVPSGDDIAVNASNGELNITVGEDAMRAIEESGMPEEERSQLKKDMEQLNRDLAEIDFSEGNVDGENRINIPGIEEKEAQEFVDHVTELVKERPKELIEEIINHLPTTMFFLPPVFALLLKLFYPFTRRYYTEHLVIVLYSQSFLFLTLLLSILFESANSYLTDNHPQQVMLLVFTLTMDSLILAWIPIGLFIMQKQVYGQGIVMTLFKFGLVATSYFILLFLTVLAAMAWSVFSL